MRYPLFTLACLILPACAVPGLGPPTYADAPLPTDTGVVAGALPNGLQYYIRVNREPEHRAELRLAVNAGSILEDEDQRGLAHFLEHMAFNGTRNFERQALIDYLESVGMRFGPDVNAYTSFDETVYMLTLPTDTAGVLESGFRILEDWAAGITLDSAEVEKERGVVLEEWRLAQSAATRMHRAQVPLLMRRSRYAERDPIGTFASLTTFDQESLRRFYRDWYRPDLMGVVAVGDFDPAEVERLIHEHFSDLSAPRRPRRRREFGVPEHRKTLVSVETDPEATGSSVSLYLKRPARPWSTVGDFRAWVVESLASSMLTNRLSESIQRPGSALLDVSSFHGRFVRPLAAHVLSIRTPEGGIERGFEALLTEVERAARHGFTATELEREKKEMMRYVEQRFAEREKTTSASFAAEYVSHYLYGGRPLEIAAEHELYSTLLPQIGLDEVNRSARPWMRDRNRVVLVRAPRKDGLDVPTPRRLERVVHRVEAARVTAYVDSVSGSALMGEPPLPGRIVEVRQHPEAGVTEWTLSNGARVLLKPTPFREDEVLLAARSPGGLSLLPDSQQVAGITAGAVVQVGGVGELSAVDLRKHLAGTVAGVGANIEDMHEGLAGAASPKDLEILFQLVYLKFTAPRVDSAAFEAYRENARASLDSRAADPEAVFADSVRLILAQHHPRVRVPSAEMFDSLDLHRSVAIYRDRFADAGDFTFYLVGSFDPDSIRPLAERYLASLPDTGRRERGRDLGIRPPRGVVRRTVHRGVEPKALTRIVFTGEFEYEKENIFTLGTLGEVLRLRLREALREDLGGTYGVQVRASAVGAPRPRYQLSIGFGSDPERLDELTRVVFAEIDSLRQRGPRPKDLQKVREMRSRSREVDLRQNHFWISRIVAHDTNGWDLAGIAAPAEDATTVEPAAWRAAAARYLDPGNYVQVSLLPERGSGADEPPG